MKKLIGGIFVKVILLVMAIISSSGFTEQVNPRISTVHMYSVSAINDSNVKVVTIVEFEQFRDSKACLKSLWHLIVQNVASTDIQN